jgi:hypothetical protein
MKVLWASSWGVSLLSPMQFILHTINFSKKTGNRTRDLIREGPAPSGQAR